jgi:HlyD family secretion protein
MTANLTITIDERNNVLKVPNAALRFSPQSANEQNRSNTDDNNGSQRQGRGQRNADGNNGQTENRLTASTVPVIAGQNRLVWVLGQGGNPQPRRITVGLSDGVSTEIVSGNVQEGDVVIIGETISGQNRTQTTQTTPGFGGAQRGGFGGAVRR